MALKTTRDPALYRELSAKSPAFRQWLNMSSYSRQKLRDQVQARDGKVCVICKKGIRNRPDLHHIVALNDGGTNELDNLGLAHKDCNREERVWRDETEAF
jgi:5-methylcytosine-specific restriction endonuclease McrA